MAQCDIGGPPLFLVEVATLRLMRSRLLPRPRSSLETPTVVPTVTPTCRRQPRRRYADRSDRYQHTDANADADADRDAAADGHAGCAADPTNYAPDRANARARANNRQWSGD